jgi:hypothetical protein
LPFLAKKKNVQSGFRDAGLVFYDPEQVIAKLDVKIHTLTPDIESLSLPESWVSQILHNSTEAQSQSTFLKSRITKHQGSSPTSIYSAINQFEKGTKIIMHRLALQDAELKLLREANKELTNRRKKKQLRKGGLCSFQDAEEQQNKEALDAQLRQETRDHGGRARRVETRAR